MINSIETLYMNIAFRSRIEARWAVAFDSLDVLWEYEPDSYDLGPKHTSWDWQYEQNLQEIYSEAWDMSSDEIRRAMWFEKNKSLLYVPDFWLPDFKCWVEIKGRAPNYEECRKAQDLFYQTREPVHILWGNIPDPVHILWGESADVYGGNMNIIALLVLDCGIKALERAFTAARQARF